MRISNNVIFISQSTNCNFLVFLFDTNQNIKTSGGCILNVANEIESSLLLRGKYGHENI